MEAEVTDGVGFIDEKKSEQRGEDERRIKA
jgi:hypothetical protein